MEAVKTKIAEKKGEIHKKLKFLKTMLKLQKVLREENESIVAIKEQNNDQLPKGMLLEGKKAIEAFMQMKNMDMQNESMIRD